MQRNSSRAEGVLRGLQFLTSKHLRLPSLSDIDDIALAENVSNSTQRLQLYHHRSRFTVSWDDGEAISAPCRKVYSKHRS